jgi:hypothetical protein
MLIAFPPQRRFHERASMLRYTYNVCLVTLLVICSALAKENKITLISINQNSELILTIYNDIRNAVKYFSKVTSNSVKYSSIINSNTVKCP